MRADTCVLLLLATACVGPAAAQKEFSGPQHRLEAALLEALVAGPLAATPLPAADCSNDASGAATLSGDVVFHLAALDGAGRVSGACEPGPTGREACRLMIGESVAGTERRWSRLYQFLRLSGGAAEPGTVVCNTIP